MAGTPKQRLVKITSIVLLFVAVLFIAGVVISTRIENSVKTKLHEAGFDCQSVTVNILARSVELDSLVYRDDQSLPDAPSGFIKTVKAGGFRIIPFLQRKEIILSDLVLHRGDIEYHKGFKPEKVSAAEDKPQKISSLTIQVISVNDLRIVLFNNKQPETSVTINAFEIGDTHVAFKQDTTLAIEWLTADLENLKLETKNGLHTFQVSKILYNSHDQKLQADSFRVFSRLDKQEFARVAKIQKTRMDVILPEILFEGVEFDRFVKDSVLAVERILLPNAVVHAYRDKRYPFVRDWIMPLPIEGIKRLPFKLDIDSILISQADIAYEEFSEKGLPATGTITFNKLDASFAALNTTVEPTGKDSFSTLVATCRVMNTGLLHATFKMPLNPAMNYEAFGSVRNMDLKSLNPALGNLTRIEIAEGRLNDLRFNFSYNDNVSTGEVLINYSDLKLSALKKDKKNHETNKLITTAINAIVKSNKDKSVDKSKRTGVINIEREKKRFVLQFWWKSLLDGLRSTFLDTDKQKKAKRPSS